MSPSNGLGDKRPARALAPPPAGRRTPASIADAMEEWLHSRGSDGFNVMFPYLPQGLDDFLDGVVPELQRRGLFRREYPGATLRETLGLPACEPAFRVG